jgi:SSS family solute:Na+ symporter
MVPLFGIFGFGIQRFRATKAMSVPQYIEMRYSKRLRILVGFFNCIAGVFQMCIFPIVGANFIKILIQAPDSAVIAGMSIPVTWIIMFIFLSSTIIFTYLGGYITLTVTNFFQMIIIMVALCWIVFLLITKTGLQAYWTGLEQAKGAAGFYPFDGKDDSYSIIWFLWLSMMSILLQFSYGPYLQKYASMDRPKTASRSYLWGTLFGNGRLFIILALGVAALGAMGSGIPSGISVGKIEWANMATPYYLSHVIPPVLMGLFLAGLLFADVATTDQYILTWSTSIINDCICPFKKTPFTSESHIKAIKKTILILCVVFFLFGMIYRPTLPIWEYLWLCANIIGGTGIAVMFGMYWKRASTAGAYAAILVSLVIPITDLVARRIFDGIHPGKAFWIKPETTGFTTYVIAAVLLVMISLLSKGKTKYWDLGQTVKEMNDVTK